MKDKREELVEACRVIIEERNRHALCEFEAAEKMADMVLAREQRFQDKLYHEHMSVVGLEQKIDEAVRVLEDLFTLSEEDMIEKALAVLKGEQDAKN